ncbi:hypothetical protein QCD70_01070 [Agreia sp. PsM10]|uniref:hypothetical protein n=1 Tax=Agreia sp. PsM10 TaxID=3030533 RepID=UPI00263AB15F|nr:hypothetical protein [Agreia sp. PsM10]MDN4638824.1 hypothetical protein [Agreia sp. PsM10]
MDFELTDGESLMASEHELIYRQITEHLMHGTNVATHAFTGATADAGKPSYARSATVSAQESRDWHAANAKSASLGVWGLTVGEVIIANSHVIEDSKAPLSQGKVRSPGHCYVDARELDRLALKDLRAQLWSAAMARKEIPTREPLADGELDIDIDPA